MITTIYHRPQGAKTSSFEEAFYIGCTRTLTGEELELLCWLVKVPTYEFDFKSCMKDGSFVEIGPRLSVETPFSSSAVAVCQSMGLPVYRIEKSSRYEYGPGLMVSGYYSADEIINQFLDPMTQEVYTTSPVTFDSGLTPEAIGIIRVVEYGAAAMRETNKTLGLGMDDEDIAYNTALFQRLGRNPTDVELFQMGNGNSEHSRHWFFRGIQVIDGTEMPESLMDIVKEPWKRNPGNSLVAFHDNAGVMRGTVVEMFAPSEPARPSIYLKRRILMHHSATAETHNHPTLIAPFPGAATGAGGRIRDNRAVGRGGLVHAGLAGYCVGNLHIPGYHIPGENIGGEISRRSASPLDALIEGSNGISRYGNEYGEPLIGGFCRSFGQMIGGARREFRKLVLYSAGIGGVLDMHVKKRPPEKGMLIVQIGGPAYRIGVGGGSASSMVHGAQGEELDFKSVQRGNAEMENRANRVIQACAELLDRNPIESIHDQGAGGPSNVLTELMEPAGGKVDIRKITVGDKTMSVLEIWVAEYQERYGLLVRPENLELLKSICERESVNCEVLGKITGDGNVVVYDSADRTTPVNLSLKDILGELPRKRFESRRPEQVFQPLVIPRGLTVDDAFRTVLALPSVCSKGFLVHKADRSVTGLVARQPCCGPNQVPVSDVGVKADGYFGLTGVATALGEQPVKMLISSAAGARMAVAEMLTNMCSAKITSLSDVRCRANWMWAAKRAGEGALLYDAASAMRDIMLELGIAIDGGKDSLSMATQIGDEPVISPGELAIMGYAPVRDITKVVTPDFKGNGIIGVIELGWGKNRLGGSALAQALGQLGDESPDIEDPTHLKNAFLAVQQLIEEGLITAYHDRSDGGLITAVAEMCIAGNCGAHLGFVGKERMIERLFHEEAGMILEYPREHARRISDIMVDYRLPWSGALGVTGKGRNKFLISAGGEGIFHRPVAELRQWWEATSIALELRQSNKETVEAERASHANGKTLTYRLSFVPAAPAIVGDRAPKVAVLRERGVNGEREMAAAFDMAGFETRDVLIKDLLSGEVSSFDDIQGLGFPGGFSYADVFGSAKGWAAPILFNPRLKEMFDRFYEREDTFSLGLCNGCQLMANIGWIPHKDLPMSAQPRLLHNKSGKFESRWVGVRIPKSPAVMLRSMEGSVLGVNVAHGEGQWHFADRKVLEFIKERQLVSLEYVDQDGQPTETYPHNPNGSPEGIAGVCSPDGRHLAMMPHPERSFLKWQWPWMPEEFRNLESSPWLQMFHNARTWCLEH